MAAFGAGRWGTGEALLALALVSDRAGAQPEPVARGEPPRALPGEAPAAPPGEVPAVTPGEAAAPEPRDASVVYSPDGGLSLTSPDGRFAVSPGVWAQMLYTLEHDAAADPKTEHGLEVRRARFVLKGHAFGKNNRFFLQLGLSPADVQVTDGVTTRSPIFDAYLEFTHLRDLNFRVGQYRVPFSRQRVIPFGELALIDRSIVNFEFNLDRDVGLDVRSGDLFGLDLLRYYAGVFVGEGRDARGAGDLGMLYVARAEVLPFGDFEDYEETDIEREPRPRVSVGVGYAFVDEGKGNRAILGPVPSDGGTTDSHHLTADVLFKLSGLTLLAEVHYRDGTRNFGDATVVDPVTGMLVPAPLEAARDGHGYFLQADYVLPELPIDVAARAGRLEPAVASSLSTEHELGGGVAWFAESMKFRIQADYFHLFAETFDDDREQVRVSARLGL